METSPVILFVYNRPKHTQKVIDSLKKNKESQFTDLIIYSDGAINSKDQWKVDSVRNLLNHIDGFRGVEIIKRSCNYGLAKSVIEGVTEVCSKYGKSIVLEDDVVVAPYFLHYMNTTLQRYENYRDVMHISSYMPNYGYVNKGKFEAFFYRSASSWGWATWNQAWEMFEPDSKFLIEKIRSSNRESEFNVDRTAKFYEMLEAQSLGKIDSWAVRWNASILINGGLCLQPWKSMSSNIGFDGSGVHCGESKGYETILYADKLTIYPSRIEECTIGLEAMKLFYKSTNKSFLGKLKSKAVNLVRS